MEKWQLQQRQSLPLNAKIILSKKRIKDWYDYWQGQVYVSFSGGKDSTVLLHIVRSMYPNVPAVFVDTGLEYPEIRQFVKSIKNVIWIKPDRLFKTIIETYGYPVVSKENARKIYQIRNTKSEKLKKLRLYGDGDNLRGKLAEKWKYLIDAPFLISENCCYWLKKKPFCKYEKEKELKPFIGMMAADSNLRETNYLKYECNAFETKRPTSNPIAFWLEENVWEYIEQNNVEYSDIYKMGYNRTGCIFCMFGVHLEKKPNRFQRMKETHPKLHKYCLEKLKLKEVLDYMNIPY